MCKWVYALRSLGIILTLSVISVCSQNMGLCVCVGGGEGGGEEREKVGTVCKERGGEVRRG